MQRWLTVINIVYWLALTLWIGAIITGAVSAVSVFGKLPEMAVTLDEFAEYHPPGEPQAHGRIAAGMVMERVFWMVDIIQFIAAPLLPAALALQLIATRSAARRPSNIVRTACIIIAIGTFAYQAAGLTPNMNRELRAYWAAAKAGQADAAREHRAAFETDHPRARLLFQVRLLALLIALGASAAALGTAPARPATEPQLQNPRLLKEGRTE